MQSIPQLSLPTILTPPAPRLSPFLPGSNPVAACRTPSGIYLVAAGSDSLPSTTASRSEDRLAPPPAQAIVATDPHLTGLDSALISKAAPHLDTYMTCLADYLADKREYSTFAVDGAVLLQALKAIKAGEPPRPPQTPAQRIIRDAVAPSQLSRTSARQQEILAFGRLLLSWGVVESMPALTDLVYNAHPYKYEPGPVHQGSLLVYRRKPNSWQYLPPKCVTSAAELAAARAALEQEYTQATAALQKRLKFTGSQSADPKPTAANRDERIAASKAAYNADLMTSLQEGLARHADRFAAR